MNLRLTKISVERPANLVAGGQDQVDITVPLAPLLTLTNVDGPVHLELDGRVADWVG
jgi:hypothetical protein